MDTSQVPVFQGLLNVRTSVDQMEDTLLAELKLILDCLQQGDTQSAMNRLESMIKLLEAE